MNKYLDSLNLPGTRQSNGTLDMGDSAAIMFNLMAFNSIQDDESRWYWNHDYNVPVRHPDKTKWWGQPDRYSRDQLIPLLCWAALHNQKEHPVVKAVFQAHKKNWFLRAWNSKRNGEINVPEKVRDFTTLEIWGLWFRIYKPIGYQILLNICDLETLFGSISWKFRKDRVTRNHMLVNITQRDISPTWISKLSYKLNNWEDLVDRWDKHCQAVGEYPTADLFKKELLTKGK